MKKLSNLSYKRCNRQEIGMFIIQRPIKNNEWKMQHV